MMCIAVAFTSIVLVSACTETTEPSVVRGNVPVPVPNPIILAGDTASGAIVANVLRDDGLAVETDFNGRTAGITAFCSGAADALALKNGQDLTSAERTRCKSLKVGWGWSALSIKTGIGLYVRYEFGADLLKKGATTFR